MSTLTATGLDCSIGPTRILSNVELTLSPGTMTALVGVNGSGKSTLMRVLAGINPPAGGTVLLDDTDLHLMPPRRRSRRLAFVGQEESPPEDLRLAEMVSLGRIPYRPPWAIGGPKERELVMATLDEVGLADLADRRCDQLSGGERRRALLARGLAQGTELLLLDEPTNHLDVRHQLSLCDLIRRTGRTVLASLHDLDLAISYFDQVIVLANGGVLAQGPPVEVLSPEVLAAAFGVNARQVALSGARPHLIFESLEPSQQTERTGKQL